MKKKYLFCAIGLSLLLSGCSGDIDVFNAEATQGTADKMTEILLDNTAFPDNESKDQLRGVIGDVTEQVIKTGDGVADEAIAYINEKKAAEQAEIENTETPEGYTEIDIPEWMADAVIVEAVKQGCIVEKVKNADNRYFIQNIDDEVNYYIVITEMNAEE